MYLCSMNIQYIAGLFDAEGYIRLTPKGGVDTKIEMTDLECIKYYADFFKLEIFQQDRGSNRKLIYHCRTSKHHKTREVLTAMLPYLNEKYFQAKCVLMYLNGGNLHVCHQAFEHYKHHNAIINKPSLSYLGGLIDGDGWASLQSTKTHGIQLAMGLKQCYAAMPTWLHTQYGGHISTALSKNTAHRDLTEWKISKEKSLALIATLKPFVIRNKKKIELIERYYSTSKEMEKNRVEALEKICNEYSTI